MLVEDNPEDVAVTKRVLKFNKLDRDMLLATSGREALRILTKLANEGEILDLILLDINLPDISGIDLLTQIKKDLRLSSIPVVILTGSNEDEDIQKCYDLGAGSYLVKPISNDALMLVIDTLFGP
ncbi:MAG: response regulator [Methanothrix sp.]|nr:response regulator [Methanothrix sp.]